jgi:hypothetical protein
LLFLFFFIFFINSNCSNKNISYYYLIGEYSKCTKIKTNDYSCEYLRSLCYIAESNFEEARYLLSLLTTKIDKTDPALYLVLNSLIEIAFITGEYSKAYNLSIESNKLCNNSFLYPCSISTLLNIKAYYSNYENNKAFNLLNSIKNNFDNFLFYSLKTDNNAK